MVLWKKPRYYGMVIYIGRSLQSDFCEREGKHEPYYRLVDTGSAQFVQADNDIRQFFIHKNIPDGFLHGKSIRIVHCN